MQLSRKKFIESNGATCRNWTWSWSFINEQQKVIIFGAWDIKTESSTSLIFSEDWRISDKGRSQAAYPQSREHLRLIEEEGYQLKIFPLIHSNDNKNVDGEGPAKIGGFIEELTVKSLKRIGKNWYASDDVLGIQLPEEIDDPAKFIEGASRTVSVNTYERSAEARTKCIEYYGYECQICSFSFKEFYGDIGTNYIHVHHVIPLSEIKKEYKLDPIKDLIPVCANCHAMIHKTRPALQVRELMKHLKERKRSE